MGEKLPEKQSTIVKRSFRSSTKPLSLDSTIPVDELTTETFYHFRTSELFNIWTPPSDDARLPSTWLTNCANSSTRLNHQLEKDYWLQSSSRHQQWRSRSTWLQNPRRKDALASFRENKALVTFCICSPCIILCDGL